MSQPPEHHDGERPRSTTLIGLVVVLLLVVVALYLVNALRKESQFEDCLMSGRTNCAPIEAPSGSR